MSVVMPCLNEEEGVGGCINKIKEVFEHNRILGEVIVVDNGSTDSSAMIASSLGAKVVCQPKKGYGAAYLKGFAEAKGEYILMGDADSSYDFLEIPRFLDALENHDLVIGNRKYIKKGAMPFLHRYVGNPFFSWLLKNLFSIRISDSHCGFGAIKKEELARLGLKSTGMEFASEILIKAKKKNLKMAEIPITYYPRKGKPKLRTFRDGLRHLVLITKEYLIE